ncbi:hypothetical protein GOP47_0030639, partial [Adiantum capillus-veneris]
MNTLKKAQKSLVAWPKIDLVTKISRKEQEELSSSAAMTISKRVAASVVAFPPAATIDKSKKSAKGKAKVQEGASSGFVDKYNSDEEIDDREMAAYMTAGQTLGEFPINEDVTVRQDMLSKHRGNLKVEHESLLPW